MIEQHRRRKKASDNKATFVLVAADADRSRIALPSAYQLAKQRLKCRRWGLRARTRFRSSMKKGDRVIIYVSGYREHAQHFVAEAVLASPPTRGAWHKPITSANAVDDLGGEYSLSLACVRWFSSPVCARRLIDKFSFISPERRSMWRIYFQGGALRLSARDAELIRRVSAR